MKEQFRINTEGLTDWQISQMQTILEKMAERFIEENERAKAYLSEKDALKACDMFIENDGRCTRKEVWRAAIKWTLQNPEAAANIPENED